MMFLRNLLIYLQIHCRNWYHLKYYLRSNSPCYFHYCPAGGVKVSTTISAHVQDTQHLTSSAHTVLVCDKPYRELSESRQHRQDRNLVTPHSSGSQLSGGIKSPRRVKRGLLELSKCTLKSKYAHSPREEAARFLLKH